MSKLRPVGEVYTASKAQRVVIFTQAAGVIMRRGYTPRLLNTADVRITLAGALVEASLLFDNHEAALEDAKFLLLSNHVNEHGTEPWTDFVWELDTEKADALLQRIADKVAAS